jgi:hypothetical protein
MTTSKASFAARVSTTRDSAKVPNGHLKANRRAGYSAVEPGVYLRQLTLLPPEPRTGPLSVSLNRAWRQIGRPVHERKRDRVHNHPRDRAHTGQYGLFFIAAASIY